MLKTELKSKQELVDQYLDQHLPTPECKPGSIFEAMRYSVFAGGKRIRPVISLMVNEMLNGKADLIMPAACSIELIHTYSLIHDDLPALDNDDFRRGKLSSHKQFGEALAILAGDSLLTLAFQWISTMNHKSDVVVSILKEISDAAGVWGMIGGQVADLEAEGILKVDKSKKKQSDEEELEYIHKHKTAALIRASVAIGAISAEVSEEEINHCREFGNLIGLAFQVADDILDIEGDEKTLGKSVGKDIESDKLTYPALYGLDGAKKKAKELIDTSIEIISQFKNNQYLVELAKLIINRKN